MVWGKTIKRRQSDILFSKYIRQRDGWRCFRCKKQFEENAPNLHASHFWGRGKESTRFDPENVDAVCSFCHRYFESNPADYAALKEKQLGKERYNALMVRANATFRKRDDKMDVLYVRQLLKEI